MITYEIRVVLQDGKLSFRKCLLDRNGDVDNVLQEEYALTCNTLEELKLYKRELDFALSLPVLLWHKKNIIRWIDVQSTDDIFEEEDD